MHRHERDGMGRVLLVPKRHQATHVLPEDHLACAAILQDQSVLEVLLPLDSTFVRESGYCAGALLPWIDRSALELLHLAAASLESFPSHSALVGRNSSHD